VRRGVQPSKVFARNAKNVLASVIQQTLSEVDFWALDRDRFIGALVRYSVVSHQRALGWVVQEWAIEFKRDYACSALTTSVSGWAAIVLYRLDAAAFSASISTSKGRHGDDPHVDASEIEVTVSSCEVTLSGTVDNRDAKRRAEDIAERVSGVKHVQNNIRVQQQTAGATSTGSATSSTAGATSSNQGATSGSRKVGAWTVREIDVPE
jgi:hypothetical protein